MGSASAAGCRVERGVLSRVRRDMSDHVSQQISHSGRTRSARPDDKVKSGDRVEPNFTIGGTCRWCLVWHPPRLSLCSWTDSSDGAVVCRVGHRLLATAPIECHEHPGDAPLTATAAIAFGFGGGRWSPSAAVAGRIDLRTGPSPVSAAATAGEVRRLGAACSSAHHEFACGTTSPPPPPPARPASVLTLGAAAVRAALETSREPKRRKQ